MFSKYSYVPGQKAINTYVPLPFNEILGAGLAKQKKYDETLASASGLFTELGELKIHPADESLYQQKIGSIQSELDEAMKTTPDLGSLEGKMAVSKVVQKYKRDPHLKLMVSNLPKATELEKQIAEARANNEEWNYFEPALKLQQFYKSGSAGTGYLGDYGVTKLADVRAGLSKMSEGLKASGYDIGNLSPGYDFHYKNSYTGVEPSKVAAIYGAYYPVIGTDPKTKQPVYGDLELASIPTSFLTSTLEGKNLVNHARYNALQNGTDPNEELKRLYLNDVKSIIYEKSYNVRGSDMDVTGVYLHNLAKKEEQIILGKPGYLPATNISGLKIDFTKTSEPKSGTDVTPGGFASARSAGTERQIKTKDVKHYFTIEEKEKISGLLNTWVESSGTPESKNMKVLWDSYNSKNARLEDRITIEKTLVPKLQKMVETIENDLKINTGFIAFPETKEGSDESKYETEAMFGTTDVKSMEGSGNYVARAFYNLTDGVYYQNGTEMQEKLIDGLASDERLKNATVRVIGNVSADNVIPRLTKGNTAFANGKVVTIGGKTIIAAGLTTTPIAGWINNKSTIMRLDLPDQDILLGNGITGKYNSKTGEYEINNGVNIYSGRDINTLLMQSGVFNTK